MNCTVVVTIHRLFITYDITVDLVRIKTGKHEESINREPSSHEKSYTWFCKWSNDLRHAPERVEVVDVLKARVLVTQAGHSLLC